MQKIKILNKDEKASSNANVFALPNGQRLAFELDNQFFGRKILYAIFKKHKDIVEEHKTFIQFLEQYEKDNNNAIAVAVADIEYRFITVFYDRNQDIAEVIKKLEVLEEDLELLILGLIIDDVIPEILELYSKFKKERKI